MMLMKVRIIVMKMVMIKFERYYPGVNPLSANPTKWSNTLKQFVPTADKLFDCV